MPVVTVASPSCRYRKKAWGSRSTTACDGRLRRRSSVTENALDIMRAAVGPAGWIDDPSGMDPYLREGRGRFRGSALAVVRPSSTHEVAAVVGAAARAGIQIVPQGGNTGLVGA